MTPLFLSQLKLNLRSRAVRRDLASPYEMHRSLSHTVDVALGQNKERLLWRVDGTAHPILLMQTRSQPDFKTLPESYLLEVATKSLNLPLQNEQVLKFRLRANPSKKVPREGKRQGKRVGLYKPDEQQDWLYRKGEANGFKVLGVALTNEDTIRTKKASQTVSIHAVTFEGTLQILDLPAFESALTNGLGAAKSLGFGLLSVAKP